MRRLAKGVWPLNGGRKPSLPLALAFTLVALSCTGFLLLAEVALFYGYIMPNDAVLGWPTASCVVNSSSIALQERTRCITESECHSVYRAWVRVQVTGDRPRELLAFDTVFGDFSHSRIQPASFVLVFNHTPAAPATPAKSEGKRKSRSARDAEPAPDPGLYTTPCSVNPDHSDSVCIDPSAPVVSARLRAALHGGPCVGRVVLGSPATYVTEFTSRGMTAHRLVFLIAAFLGPFSLLFTYCACLGCALRRGCRTLATCLRPPFCRRVFPCCACCRAALPGDPPKLSDELTPLGARSNSVPGRGGSRSSRTSWHSGDRSSGQPQHLRRGSATPHEAPLVVSAHALLGPDGARADVAAASRALGKVGSHAWRSSAAAEGAAGDGPEAKEARWRASLAAARLAQGNQEELGKELWRDARVRRATSAKPSGPPRFIVYSPSEAAAKGLVEVAASDGDGKPTAMRLVQHGGGAAGLARKLSGTAGTPQRSLRDVGRAATLGVQPSARRPAANEPAQLL